jgi:hypothetical protein
MREPVPQASPPRGNRAGKSCQPLGFAPAGPLFRPKQAGPPRTVIRPFRIVPGARARRGISLLVVLLALSLVAVLAIVAIPLYFSRPAVTLDNACDVLKRDLRAAQGSATLSSSSATFVFLEDGWHALDATGEPIVVVGETHALLRRFSHDGVFDGVRVARIEFGPDHAVHIDRDGLLGETGELVLEFGGERRRVVIEKGAGYVLVDPPESSVPNAPGSGAVLK